MYDSDRLLELARAAHAYSKDRLPVAESFHRDSIATSKAHMEDAVKHLVLTRKNSTYYKGDPSKQKRHILKSKKDKDYLDRANEQSFSYTLAERYAVLDQEIKKGSPAGFALAILAHDLAHPLDVNTSYVSDAEGKAVSTGKPNGWLDLAAKRSGPNDVELIRLLADSGASQDSRNRALNIALGCNALETAQELIRNSADPNANGNADYFIAAIKDQNQRLYSMFLSAPVPMSPFYINQALIEAVGRDSDLVALLIAHGADGMVNDGQALCAAVGMKSLQDAAMILCNPDCDLLTASLDAAVYPACMIAEEHVKLWFLEMLLCAGATANTSKLQDELLTGAQNNIIALVELLTRHGTSPVRNGAEGLRVTVISGQVELVHVLLQGPIPQESLSHALEDASSLGDPDTFEEIVKALVEKGVPQASLSKCLAESVEKGFTALVPMLIQKGATLDYGNAQCVRTALVRNDFGLFGRLLGGSCDPSVLCLALTDAMKIEPPSERLEIMSQLFAKGVSGKELHVALQAVSAVAKDQADYSLIEKLINNQASVDFSDDNGNCICTAAAQLNERVLDLLCHGTPNPKTVSAAVGNIPVSFAKAEAQEYEQQVEMISLLLEKGAGGVSVSELLVKAVQDDHREKALKTLIRHGADANYQNGKAVHEALALKQLSALQLIIKHCKLERTTFESQLPVVLNSKGFSLEKAALLAETSMAYGYKGVLDQPLLDEVEHNGARKEVIQLFLGLGASANHHNGRALQVAIRAGNVEVSYLLLHAGVTKANIATAFPKTSDVIDRPSRYTLMQGLLEAGGAGLGQDQALIQAAQEAAFFSDLTHVELLLLHQASPNFKDGAAVLDSIRTNNLPLLKRFVRTKLNKKTLSNAFTFVRKADCTAEERYNASEALLEAYSNKNDISLALIEAIKRDCYDIQTSTLLLDHGASLELENGLALQLVAAEASMEVLELFLSKNPSQAARDISFHAATHSAFDIEKRLAVYQTLLETKITTDFISAAVLQATWLKIVDHSLLSLLIAFNASLDFDNGSALYRIVTSGDSDTVTVLLHGKLKQKQTLDRAFSAAMGLSGSPRLIIAKSLLERDPGVSTQTISHYLAKVVTENDHNLLALMIEYKPDPAYNGGESLIRSARAGDVKSTELLASVEVNSDIIALAFQALLDACTIQSVAGGLETAKILLAQGVPKPLVDRALLDGFDHEISQLTKDLVDLLIRYGPDVCGGDGKIFVDIAKTSDFAFFKLLASQKPDLNVAIPALIRSVEKEEDLIPFLEILEACSERGDVLLEDFVIFSALTQFPEGPLLTKHLLNHGCAANSKTDAALAPHMESEDMTLLIWALSRVTSKISEDVIAEILEQGDDGELSFQTPVARASAIILASAARRNTVLKRLLELGADVSLRDREEHSALFYSSRNGYLDTTEMLIEAGAHKDDGSLHEAAREAHPAVLELLLAHGHRADFPSSIHADESFGRTALEELCLNATPGGDGWQKRIHSSIALLLPAQVKDIAKSGGKTMLHLALENEDSVDVMRELLSFPPVWENINHPVYLYQDTVHSYVYSPTKYVELGFASPDAEKCQQLITLLRARKCQDRFYAHTIEQPEGAIGLPEALQEQVNAQNRADYEKAQELKRRREIEAQQRIIDTEEYQRKIKADEERHGLLIKQRKDQEKTDKQIADERQKTALRHARERQDAAAAENRVRLDGMNEEAQRRKAHMDSQQASELNHRRNLERAESDALQSKLSYEQQLISMREAASRSEFNRQVELCERKEQSAKYQAQQRMQAPQY